MNGAPSTCRVQPECVLDEADLRSLGLRRRRPDDQQRRGDRGQTASRGQEGVESVRAHESLLKRNFGVPRLNGRAAAASAIRGVVLRMNGDVRGSSGRSTAVTWVRESRGTGRSEQVSLPTGRARAVVIADSCPHLDEVGAHRSVRLPKTLRRVDGRSLFGLRTKCRGHAFLSSGSARCAVRRDRVRVRRHAGPACSIFGYRSPGPQQHGAAP